MKTVDDVLAALARVGPPANPGPGGHVAPCPVCSTDGALTISQNGNGPHLACTNDCHPQAIVALLERLPSLPGLAATPEQTLAGLRDSLAKAAARSTAFPPIRRPVIFGDGDAHDVPLDDGTDRVVRLGNAEALGSQPKFRAAWRRVGVQLASMKLADFDAIVQDILDCAEHGSDLSTDDEEARDWIAAYLRTNGMHRHVDRGDPDELRDLVAMSDPPPFIDRDGRLHLRLGPLQAFIGRALSTRVTQPDLSLRLARLGFTSPDDGGTIAARLDTGPRTVRYWLAPVGFELPPEPRSRLNTRTDSTSRGNNGNTDTRSSGAGTAHPVPDTQPGTAGNSTAEGTPA